MKRVAIGYKPSWGQYHFHMMRNRSKVRFACGGLGSGKTAAGAVEALIQGAGAARGATGMIITPSYQTFDQVTMKEIRKWWPEGHWRLNKGSGSRVLELFWGDGLNAGKTEVLVRSAKDARVAAEIRGPDIHWIWGDEPGTWGAGMVAWENALGRLRQPAPNDPTHMTNIFLTGTPVWGWINKAFEIKGRLPAHAWTSGLFTRGHNPTTAFYVRAMRSEDNAANQAEGYTELLRTVYGETFAAQELSGDFMPPTGAVFPRFYRDHHVIPHDVLMGLYWKQAEERIGGVDWGFGSPGAIVGLGITGDHGLLVAKEWSEPRHTAAMMAQIAVAGFEADVDPADVGKDPKGWGKGGLNITDWYPDSADDAAVATWRSEVAGVAGVNGRVHNVDKSRKDGLDTVRHLMRLNTGLKHPVNPDLPGSWFYLSDRCTGLASDIEGYRYRDVAEGAEIDDSKTTGLAHRIDALRYPAHSALREFRGKPELRRI